MPTPELNKALAAFQAELPHVAKAATADTGSYRYDYADLEDVSRVVLPLLGKHGLAWSAWTELRDDGRQVLAYALAHASGEERGGQYLLPPPDKATAQQMGSALTYARRYTLCAITGVAPGGEDDDGKAASSTEPAPKHIPAGRTNGDNPWENPTPTYLTGITREFKRLQITDRDVRLGYVAKIIGRAVTTPAQLTSDEQKSLLQYLSKSPDEKSLDQQARQEAST